MIKTEIYKIINGFPNYMISNLGNVYSIKNDIVLKPIKNNCGYLWVSLFNEKGMERKTIHKLVAEHFLDSIEGKTEINHLDENKENNSVDNLCYCTHRENLIYSLGRKIKTSLDETFDSISEAAEALMVNRNGIDRALKTGNKYKGRTFTYINIL